MFIKTLKVTGYDSEGSQFKTMEYVLNSDSIDDMFAAGQGTMVTINNVLVHILVDFEKLCETLKVEEV